MNGQPPRTYTRVAVAIVVAAVIVAAAILATSAIGTTVTKTTTLTVSSTNISTMCIRSGQGYAFYVRVVADETNTPISGAEVNAISYTSCMPSGITDWGTPIIATTSDNGTVSFPVAAIGGYDVIVNYNGNSYSLGDVFIAPVQITTVTVSIPSGNVTTTVSAPL